MGPGARGDPRHRLERGRHARPEAPRASALTVAPAAEAGYVACRDADLAEPGLSAFDDLADLDPLAIWDGVLARVVDGERVGLAVVELDPGSVVREHAHANEQLGMVLGGSLAFRVGDELRELRPGQTWRIPPDVPHEVTAGPEGAVVIDVFAPPRTDWADVERAGPRSPRWP